MKNKKGGGPPSKKRPTQQRGKKTPNNRDQLGTFKRKRHPKASSKRERTTLRKQSRLAKKAKRHGRIVEDKAEKVDDSVQQKIPVAPVTPVIEKSEKTDLEQRDELKNEMKSLKKQQRKRRVENLKADNELEDKNIKALERKLKINKRKSKSIPNAFVMDGLDYILEACELRKLKPELELDDCESNFDSDLAMATGKAVEVIETKKRKVKTNPAVDAANKKLKLDNTGSTGLNSESKKKVTFALPSDDDDDDDDVAGRSDDVDSEDDTGNNSDMSSEESDDSDETSSRTVMDMWEEDDEDAKEMEASNVDDEQAGAEESLASVAGADGVWEDIYGRRRAKDGDVLDDSTLCGDVVVKDVSTRYVPPALRNSGGDAKKSEALVRLSRQMKGFLNRLSESNMKSIGNDIEELYMKNSRNDMNETLIKLIMESVVQVALTPERLIQEHVFLVALLHANVGTEVGARFLEAIVEKFTGLLKLGANYGDGKQCDNLIQFLVHIYNFKIVHCLLIYDILQLLAESFQEKDIELILLILRGAGFTLRKDDALSLKNFILKIQPKAENTEHLQDKTRVKFMLETLVAVRNNNMHKIPNYDTSHAEHLKKIFKAFVRKGCSVQELKISLEDLSNVQLRGRWWVVGSAWTGLIGSEETSVDKRGGTAVLGPTMSDEILALAHKQRINTDVRKNIFSVIMTAEDYIDAFENLLRLGLKNLHEREIIYVIQDCCLQEKAFNPYYAHLLQRFCEADSKYKIMIQCAFWDKIKEIHPLKAVQISNMAQLLLHLIVNGALALSVLKVIEFAEMDKNLVRFLRQILLGLLLHPSDEKFAAALKPAAKSPKLHIFRVGLCLFMRHFILKNKDKIESDINDKLRERVDMADTILSTFKSVAVL